MKMEIAKNYRRGSPKWKTVDLSFKCFIVNPPMGREVMSYLSFTGKKNWCWFNKCLIWGKTEPSAAVNPGKYQQGREGVQGK